MMKHDNLCWQLIFLVLWTVFANVAANETLQVVHINPTGKDVPAGRQIVVQFNHDVVPIGRMQRKRQEIPVSISPAVECAWRWLDRTSLACQLSEKNALKKATRYNMTVWPGIKDQQGKTITKPFVHTFSTERPKLNRIWFKTWKGPGVPLLRAVFNQPVTQASVEQHVFPVFEGKRYTVKVQADANDKQTVLKSGEQPARRIWLLQPTEALPLDSRIQLHIEPGLISALGRLSGIEQRSVMNFDTFPEFSFNGIHCRTNQNEEILITATNRQQHQCNPLSRIALNFSVPVVNSEVSHKIHFTPDLAGKRKDYDPWANREDYSRLRRSHSKGESYNVWLPEILKADQLYQLQAKPAMQVKDEFGRSLTVSPNMWFHTDHRLPDFSLAHYQSVLESGIDSELPIYVTNLNKFTINYNSLTASGSLSKQQASRPVEQVEDVSFAKPVGIRDLLQGQSGAVYGYINSDPAVKKSNYERRFFAQVSPYQVHVKLGHFNTLVWVTDFATGKAVPDAHVSLYKDAISVLSDQQPVLASAMTDSNGVALLAGTQQLDPELKTFGWRCAKDACPKLLVRIDKADAMALLPLNHQFEVNTFRASGYSVFSRQQKKYGHIHSWGLTAQGVYRAGDTMQFKLYVRNQDNQTLVAPPTQTYQLEIIDPSGKTVHKQKDVQLSEFGAYHGEYKIPKTALVGWYRFKLSAPFSRYNWQPMRVLVSDFTPSPFKVSNELNGELFHPGDQLNITTVAKLHSGGAYTNAQAKVIVTLQSRHFSSDHVLAKGFSFDNSKRLADKLLLKQVQPLDYKGQNQQQLKLPENKLIYGKLRVESSVQDDRGKSIATRTTADYLAVDRLVGLKSTQWVFAAGKPADVDYLVVDEQGKPVAATPVTIHITHQETLSARVKGAGNAYLTQYKTEWREISTCQGVSASEAQHCRFIPEQPGTYRLIAKINDTGGQTHQSQIDIWVAGKGRVIWAQANDNSLPIIPEQTDYKIGDTARYLIKNPYPGANALITLERYGVIKQWSQILHNSTEIIEFPIEKDLLPGFYLSVVVMSPRVDKPLENGQIDLGKPAFKMGYVKVPVNDPWKQIKVDITTDAPVYKPGDLVTARIQTQVKNRDQPEPVELAVAVLDEAVLDLITGGKKYFDPYRGFYRLDGLDLQNYSLLTRLIGRQKFEKKGANAGGDGGHAISMRSLFKYVSYWNPSLTTDANGAATISFKLPDNLTGWRILVMAVTPTDRMGLGDINFKVNQNTQIRPVMPNQVIEGDSFQAGFSVMNRTDKQRQLTVSIAAEGDLSEFAELKQSISLAAYQRQTVFSKVNAAKIALSRAQKQGQIRFTAKAYDQLDSDGLVFQLPVLKRRALETAANYSSSETGRLTESILIPDRIYPDVGTLSVLLSPSVIGNIDGAFKYLRDYPYACWEQKLTKAVMAAHFIELKPWLEGKFDWPKSTELSKTTLAQAANYQAPNGGMAYYIGQNRYVSPYLSAYTALAFNWLRDSGYSIPQQVEQNLQAYLLKLLRKDVLPDFYNKGMAATVRAVALAALSDQGKLKQSDIERYHSHVGYMSLFGKAFYLQAALTDQSIIKQLTDQILAHAQQSGGKFSFNEQLDERYTRILATPMRTNCAVLSALLKHPLTGVPNLPFKLVRSITQTRGNRDHWENTQENIFCMKALLDYSQRYEAKQPKLSVSVDLEKQTLGRAVFDDYRNKPIVLQAPIKADMLGQQQTVTINRAGQGRLYHTTRLQYAPLAEADQRSNAGIDIRRQYSVERDNKWLLLDLESDPRGEIHIKRGELVRVDIYLSLPTARNFVVVDDPVPGGLEPVNRDLATTSVTDAEQGDFPVAAWWHQFDDWMNFNVSRWSFYHQEIKHDRVRFYSDYLPAGRYHLAYTAQAIAVGEFTRMPVFAEEMYDPDVFGKGKSGRLIVQEVPHVTHNE